MPKRRRRSHKTKGREPKRRKKVVVRRGYPKHAICAASELHMLPFREYPSTWAAMRDARGFARFHYMMDVFIALPEGAKVPILGFELPTCRRTFYVPPSVNQLARVLDEEPQWRYMHEEFQANVPCRVFVDIDRGFDRASDFEPTRAGLLARIAVFTKACDAYLRDVAKLDLAGADGNWTVLEAHDPAKKVSFHVVGHHRTADGAPVYFRDVRHVGLVVQCVQARIRPVDRMPSQPPRQVLDLQVYLPRKSLRMAYCQKRKGGRPLVPAGAAAGAGFDRGVFCRTVLQWYEWREGAAACVVQMGPDDAGAQELSEIHGIGVRTVRAVIKRSGLRPQSHRRHGRGAAGTAAVRAVRAFVVALYAHLRRTGQFGHLPAACPAGLVSAVKSSDGEDSAWVELSTHACFLEKCEHSHLSGRSVLLKFSTRELMFWCLSSRHAHSGRWFLIRARKPTAALPRYDGPVEEELRLCESVGQGRMRAFEGDARPLFALYAAARGAVHAERGDVGEVVAEDGEVVAEDGGEEGKS